ncbi:hypothetical protein [Mucilaginibacter aquaedulcis]|uniref:hypothetical protein n=1 Tax=Mucilaginibacter aquaedulcis TaxID=1187081 RepID=UPI0025B48AAA|nr:hypothetical protein [Mucilaginibacter aquaedulcis]MDN3548173.1 hypothetical protein [Mucilaginibacter aquaedulcis]
MITIKLAKHYQDDIATYELPLPKEVESDGYFILKFKTPKDFLLYSMKLVDIRDRLEFEIIMRSKVEKYRKLVFCKKLIQFIEAHKSNLN